MKKELARYDVPVFRLGRLAVDRAVRGQGLGGQLLLAAGRRGGRGRGGRFVINAENEGVAGWYEAYGALPLLDAPRSLRLLLATVEAALKAAGRL